MADIKITLPESAKPGVTQYVAMPAYQNPADRAHVQFLKEQQILKEREIELLQEALAEAHAGTQEE